MKQDALVAALAERLAAVMTAPLIVDDPAPLTLGPQQLWAGLMLSDSAAAQTRLIEAELGSGQAGEPGLYEIAPELVLRVAASTARERRALIDPIIAAVRDALLGDPTLGGAAFDVLAGEPRRDLAASPGQIAVEETTIPIRIAFFATDSLE